MGTAPWDPSAPGLLRTTIRQPWRVEFSTAAGTPIPVQAETCQVTLDPGWTPYAQGTVTGPVPEDQATLDALDPRRLARCRIYAGYMLPGDVEDVHLLATLYVSRRTVDRPTNVLTMEVQGAEYLYDAWRSHTPAELTPAGATSWTGVEPTDYVAHLFLHRITGGLGEPPSDGGAGIPPAGFDRAGATSATSWGVNPEVTDGNGLEILRDIAARVSAWFRCDELGVWRMTDDPIQTPISLQLQVGAGGTVLVSSTELTREGWANDVVLSYLVTDEGGLVLSRVTGLAKVATGPYTPASAGRVTSAHTLPGHPSQAAANNAAVSRLRRLVHLGRVIALEAIAAYWVRPFDTVTIQLPVGPQERHRVASVTWQLDQGSMSLRTYLPLDGTITGG
jgi:hypothetical protein